MLGQVDGEEIRAAVHSCTHISPHASILAREISREPTTSAGLAPSTQQPAAFLSKSVGLMELTQPTVLDPSASSRVASSGILRPM